MNDRPMEPTRAGGKTTSGWLPWILVLVGAIVYGNSLKGPFVFDDLKQIVNEQSICNLWPVLPVLKDSNRPIVKLSLAMNYAIGGHDVIGYHLFNVAVHILASMTLYGVLRRTLLSTLLKPRFMAAAPQLAFAAALIWLVHPLQTQAVTYVIQRSESLMGLFYLLVLYCVIRAAHGSCPLGWSFAAVVACGLGMGTKETMATAPLVVWLYDRTFLSGSFRESIRRRWPLYMGMAATWIVLYGLVETEQVIAQHGSSRLGLAPINPIQYVLSQPEIILHYLRLSIWPHPQVLDYWWPHTKFGVKVVPPTLTIVGLVAASFWATWRRNPLGFAGIWFFLILGPTSSFFPIPDLAVEHRMYLSLAALTMLAVVAGHQVVDRLGVNRRLAGSILVIAVAVSLGAITSIRNEEYRDQATMWQSVVDAVPHNPRAHNNLGLALMSDRQNINKAMEQFKHCLQLKPDNPEGNYNLGKVYQLQGENKLAIESFRKAVQINDKYSEAHYSLGNVLDGQGDFPGAIHHYRRAIELRPDHAKTHNNLGALLAMQRQFDLAIHHFQEAVRIKPPYATAHLNLGQAYRNKGMREQAEYSFRQAVRLDPKLVRQLRKMGVKVSDETKAGGKAED